MLEAGKVSIHDDREVVPPWGINGGLHGGTSSKWLISAGSDMPDANPVEDRQSRGQPGDRVVFKTAGSGGWGDPLDRDAEGGGARRALWAGVGGARPKTRYGVVLTPTNTADLAATAKRRNAAKEERGAPQPFDFGYHAAGPRSRRMR